MRAHPLPAYASGEHEKTGGNELCTSRATVPEVTIEFFGIPRQRAGRADLAVRADTVGNALAAVVNACPALADVFLDGKLAPHYRLSINGQRFVSEMGERLESGIRLLLLSADAGG